MKNRLSTYAVKSYVLEGHNNPPAGGEFKEENV